MTLGMGGGGQSVPVSIILLLHSKKTRLLPMTGMGKRKHPCS